MTRYYLARAGEQVFCRVEGTLPQAKREAAAFSRMGGGTTVHVFRHADGRVLGKLVYTVRAGVSIPMIQRTCGCTAEEG